MDGLLSRNLDSRGGGGSGRRARSVGPGRGDAARAAVHEDLHFPVDPCVLSHDQTRVAEVDLPKLGFHRTRRMPLREAYLSTFTSPRCDDSLKPALPS
jgi:hypothetical protein